MKDFMHHSLFMIFIFLNFAKFSTFVQQAGELRSSQDTLLKIEAQVQAACLGVAQVVKDLQTETGVKDAFTQSAIDELITSARNMQKLQPHKPAAEIQAELMLWVNANKARVYNPFLTMKGKYVWSVFWIGTIFTHLRFRRRT